MDDAAADGTAALVLHIVVELKYFRLVLVSKTLCKGLGLVSEAEVLGILDQDRARLSQQCNNIIIT